MTRKRFNVVTIAAMLVILALGGLGVSYAAFTDQIRLMDAQVKTGNVNVVWNSVSVSGENDVLGKATCTVIPSSDNKTIDVRVENAYPGYKCSVSGNMLNNGSLPVIMDGSPVITDGDVSGEIDFDASCTGLNTQIADGASIPCTGYAEVLSGAQEGTTYKASVTVNFKLP